MQTEFVLELRNVSKLFPGVKALQDVSLAIRYGEIHCLVGENGSGKSTLIRSVSGVEPFDEGEIVINGHEYRQLHARQAMQEGIQVIYQDLSLFPNLTVAENIAFNWLVENSRKFVGKTSYVDRAREGLGRLGTDIDLHEIVENLPMSQKQIVAIARAIVLDAKLLILDEPTTALTKREIDTLLKIIQDLKFQNISILFISHKLDEVFRVADNITVLRDGRKIGDFAAHELDERRLSFYMTGREVSYKRFEPTIKNGTPVVEVRNLTRKPHFADVSFSIKAGEIVGITGPLGAGRTELALSLFGLNHPQSGEIRFLGHKVSIDSPLKARDLGIALLPEDRHSQGLFKTHSIADNIVAAILDKLRSLFLLDRKRLKAAGTRWFSELKIKAPSEDNEPESLSGGNQQRVVLGKWLATEPKLFILDSPTVGIDVGSKTEIHEIIHNLARAGMAILLISDEIPEVYHNCSRVLVMRDGRIIEDMAVESATEDRIRELVEERV